MTAKCYTSKTRVRNMRSPLRITLYVCVLLVGIALISVFVVPRQAARVYNGVRWRLQARTGVVLPNLLPPVSASGRPIGLEDAATQPEQEAEEDRLARSLPGYNRGPFQNREYLSYLPEPFQTLLVSMHQLNPQKGTDGASHPLSRTGAGITPEDGKYIYELCKRVRPERTLEAGFAEGFSAMYFLAAAKSNGKGFHVSAEPFELSYWHGVGLQKVQESGMKEQFRFMNAKSVAAFPALGAEGLKFQVIFIDGDHRFDTQLADFVLSDELCPKGGYILLHDVWMASTRKLMSFIDRNRPDYKRHPTNVNLGVYEKVGDDRRDWRHFVAF